MEIEEKYNGKDNSGGVAAAVAETYKGFAGFADAHGGKQIHISPGGRRVRPQGHTAKIDAVSGNF